MAATTQPAQRVDDGPRLGLCAVGAGNRVITDTNPVSIDQGRDGITTFIVLDRIGAAAGGALVLVVNGLFIRSIGLWAVLATIVVLLVALTEAHRRVEQGALFTPLLLITAGNWLVALTVAAVLPFLWPVMVLTVLMPVVLGTPYLNRQRLLIVILVSATVAGVAAGLGLLNDDGGALPDLEDELELVAVVGALMGQIAPIGLIVWQNNKLQRENLIRATELNSELVDSQQQLASSRLRVVQAADTERRRIERDLHDGAQQRLVALGVRLRLLESQTKDLPEVHGSIETLIAELDGAVEEVRELAQGIYPPLLQSRGLVDALSAVARRSAVPVRTALDDIGRLDQSVETALYFAALEALTNAAKHAPDSSVDLTLTDDDGTIVLTVTDDGPGFVVDHNIETQGTNNMGDRLATVGGTLKISSTPGRGTTVDARVVRDL